MKKFKHTIERLTPKHDYPAGLIHPYWARKPFNIVESLICHYSTEGDTIADPFMGSGTSVIAAIKNNRNVIGSDLSPISKLIVKSILESAKSPSKYKKILEKTMQDWIAFSIDLYKTTSGKCVERENFIVSGDYVNGNFSLDFEAAKLKPVRNNELSGKIEIVDSVKYQKRLMKSYSKKPIDFSKICFTENTRIAVHKGVKASDFFTKRNIIFINYALQYIVENLSSNKEKDFIRLFLSSMIPMLRLSDKKASSQWPYWRPKRALTSRNPIVAIKRRQKSFLAYLNWEKGALNNTTLKTRIYQCPAKNFSKKFSDKVDLIITDPPYSDHAPYMEYSDLYWSIVSGKRTDHLWKEEIVITNAVGRIKDSKGYTSRMFKSFCSILTKLKDNGYFIFFYLDKNINHWASIKEALKKSDCIVEDIFALPKQRRSMKTVATPGKTLDGDLIIICKKNKAKKASYPLLEMAELLNQIKGNTYFDRFCYFISNYLTNDITDIDNWNLKDISRLL